MTAHPPAAAPPAGYGYGDRYRPSWRTVLHGIAAIALGRPRSLGRDAMGALTDTPLAPLLRGLDRVPTDGPFVVVGNHYERPGLWMAWPALLVAQAVWERTGQSVRWVAIREWESYSVRGIAVPPALTRAVFERAFATYGILAMAPPGAGAAERARSMKAALRAARDGAIVGLMPEGDVGPTPDLLPARAGSGQFVLLLSNRTTPILPVGLYEEEGRLVARFGDPFLLDRPAGAAGDEADAWARTHVMLAIRNLLPEALWGAYRDA